MNWRELGSTAQQPEVVVTGAAGGLGRAIARAFAKRGAHVGLIARGGAGITLQAVIGTMAIPGLLDFYLARTGYKGQQTARPVSPDRPDNLWEPVPGDHGPHGILDDRARESSPELWLAAHERELALGALGAGVAGAATALLRRALR